MPGYFSGWRCMCTHSGLANLELGLGSWGYYSEQKHVCARRCSAGLGACLPGGALGAVSQTWDMGTHLLSCMFLRLETWAHSCSAAQGCVWQGGLRGCFSGPEHGCMTCQLSWVSVFWGWSTGLFLRPQMGLYNCLTDMRCVCWGGPWGSSVLGHECKAAQPDLGAVPARGGPQGCFSGMGRGLTAAQPVWGWPIGGSL